MTRLRTNTLRITETFLSLQGEGIHAGLPCFFIRSAGCDLRCSWCDTGYSFSGGEKKTLDDLMGLVPDEVPLVQITGGEPMLQEEAVCALIEALQERGKKVLLETGGHHSLEHVPQLTHIVMDIKLPGSMESGHDFAANIPFLKPDDEIKFVVADRRDYEWARDWIERSRLDRCCNLLMSPVFGTMAPAVLAGWVLEDRLPVRMQIQLHKYIWDPQSRGV